MKDFLKEYGLWALFVVALVSLAMALLSVFGGSTSPLTNITKIVTAPFREAYIAVASWFNDTQNYYKDTTAMKQELDALRKRVAEMEEENRQAVAALAENKLFRELLDLRPQKYDLNLESAMITERTTSNWTSSLTLNKGSDHGIEVNDCVIDQTYALVGMVDEVGSNWCTVLTLVDTEISLGAQVFRSKDLGLAEGDFSLMEQGLLRLNYLPAECVLLSGDLVQTSGLGGFIPSGLKIGTIEEVQVDDSSASAILTPSVRFDDLTEVFVIKSFDIVT